MDRRRFLAQSAAAASVAGLAACGPGPGNGRRNTGASRETGPGIVTRPRLRWRLASSFPGALDVIHGGAVTFADRLRQLTDGRFEVEVFEAGESGADGGEWGLHLFPPVVLVRPARARRHAQPFSWGHALPRGHV